MERRGSRSSSSSSLSSERGSTAADTEADRSRGSWINNASDSEEEDQDWQPPRRGRLRSGGGGRTSSTDDEGSDGGGGVVGTLGLNFGVEEDDDDDEEEDMDDDVEDEFDVHRSPPAAITWPPAVADNSNRPSVGGAGKKKKPGIVYLSSIPTGFNVSRTTGFFAQYGRVGRVYLQPDVREKATRKDKIARNFTEGWIEFMSKKLAKEVASNLNLSQVGGKKRSKAHDVTWNIKYLPGFKWTHLSEKLAYEKAVHQQRMRTEISQARRETDFFKSNLEKSKRLEKRKSSINDVTGSTSAKRRMYEFRQKEPDQVIRNKKKKGGRKPETDGGDKNDNNDVIDPDDDDEDEEEDAPITKKRRLSGTGQQQSKKSTLGVAKTAGGRNKNKPVKTTGKASPKTKKVPDGKKVSKSKAATAAAASDSIKSKTKSKQVTTSRKKASKTDRSELLKSLM